MYRCLILGAAVLAASLGGCKPQASISPSDPHRGRYAGVGIYLPQDPWARLKASQPTKDTPAARLVDDQAIIVVVDSQTGELRACGDLSGYCIRQNPWANPLEPSRTSPVDLTAHHKPEESGGSTEAAKPALVQPPDGEVQQRGEGDPGAVGRHQ